MEPYELIDAGDGRRLERFGARTVDRPAPGALEPRRDPGAWARADLRFLRYRGWEARDGDTAPSPWSVAADGVTVELRATDSGQVGLFPEQLPSWRWVRARVAELVARTGAALDDPAPDDAPPPPRVLNLFGYTGVATLTAAAAGAHVAHVDASRPSIAWARHNAALSGLEDRPVRWLVDDVEGFVAREQRRDARYHGIILDPPSYGHGRGGRAWRLEERLPGLLAGCARLLADEPAFMLLTAHTPGFDGPRLADELAAALGRRASAIESGALELRATSGARLGLGAFARWPG